MNSMNSKNAFTPLCNTGSELNANSHNSHSKCLFSKSNKILLIIKTNVFYMLMSNEYWSTALPVLSFQFWPKDFKTGVEFLDSGKFHSCCQYLTCIQNVFQLIQLSEHWENLNINKLFRLFCLLVESRSKLENSFGRFYLQITNSAPYFSGINEVNLDLKILLMN